MVTQYLGKVEVELTMLSLDPLLDVRNQPLCSHTGRRAVPSRLPERNRFVPDIFKLILPFIVYQGPFSDQQMYRNSSR